MKKNWYVEYKHDNGYSCGCCHHSWEFEEEYNSPTEDELVEEIAKHIVSDHDGSCEVVRIEEVTYTPSIAERLQDQIDDRVDHYKEIKRQEKLVEEEKKKLEDEKRREAQQLAQ